MYIIYIYISNCCPRFQDSIELQDNLGGNWQAAHLHWIYFLQLACGNKYSMMTYNVAHLCLNKPCSPCPEHPHSDVGRACQHALWSWCLEKGSRFSKTRLRLKNCSFWEACFRFRNFVQFSLLHFSVHVVQKHVWYTFWCSPKHMYHPWQHQARPFSR